MTPDQFDQACRALPGATMNVQWGDDHVYKVGGKMFAVYGPSADSFSFKASDIAFAVLTETGPGKPAPYLARAKWVWFERLKDQDADEVAGWLKSAHGLIAARLTRTLRAELGV